MLERWRLLVPWLRAFVIVALLGAVARPFGGVPTAQPAVPEPVLEDPDDVHSTTHQINVSSTNSSVTVAWSSRSDVRGYSVDWTEVPVDLPDTIADLSGSSIGTTSGSLSPGSWYFHLRTQGETGEWTSTVHLGPFVIEAPLTEAPPPPLPALSIAGTRVDEGDGGSPEARFVVTLSKRSKERVRVNYSTLNGTASPERDYDVSKGTLRFKPGQKKRTLSIAVAGDNAKEPKERFFVRLSNPINARIEDGRAGAVIVDDDVRRPPPSLAIQEGRVTEGTGGATGIEFTVSLSRVARRRVAVDFRTVGGTANAPEDFRSKRGTLRFSPGQTEATVTVNVRGDDIYESDEIFFVDLAQAKNATIDDGRAQGTIVDDDRPPEPSPMLSINDITIDEGTGGRRRVQFTLTLSRRADERVAVDFRTIDGSATAPQDYTGKSGRVGIRPGERRRVITVTLIRDELDEANERFFVALSNPSRAKLADRRGRATIVDDDA